MKVNKKKINPKAYKRGKGRKKERKKGTMREIMRNNKEWKGNRMREKKDKKKKASKSETESRRK